MAWFSLPLVQFSTYSISVVSPFALVLPMASFSLNLVQFSANFISLVSTFVVFVISIKHIAIGDVRRCLVNEPSAYEDSFVVKKV